MKKPGKIMNAAFAAAVLAGFATTAGCSGGPFGGSAAKYYEAAEFASAAGAAQVAELESEGLGYFDSEGGWCWGGTPEDNPCAGPVWISFYADEYDRETGRTNTVPVSRDALESGTQPKGYEASWADVPCQRDSVEALVASLSEKFGLGEAQAEGWSSDKARYTAAGPCKVGGEDGYWTLEAMPSISQEDACSIRLTAKTLDGRSIETAATIAVGADFFAISPENAAEEGADGDEAEDGADSPAVDEGAQVDAEEEQAAEAGEEPVSDEENPSGEDE